MNLFRLLVASSLLVVPVFACGGVDDSTEETEQDLTSAGKALVGAYHFLDSSAQQNTWTGLVLTSTEATTTTNRFFADVYTGEKCVPGSDCATSVRVEGRFKATKKTLTLTPDDATFADLFGKFTYKLTHTKTESKLTLTRKGGTKHTFTAAESYCNAQSALDDCLAQRVLVPECFGIQFSCNEANSCEWHCGEPPKMCDGFAGIACPEGQFCVHPAGSCQGADISGTCVTIDKCSKELRHVCGCDGQTYANECLAAQSGVQVDREGFCE